MVPRSARGPRARRRWLPLASLRDGSRCCRKRANQKQKEKKGNDGVASCGGPRARVSRGFCCSVSRSNVLRGPRCHCQGEAACFFLLHVFGTASVGSDDRRRVLHCEQRTNGVGGGGGWGCEECFSALPRHYVAATSPPREQIGIESRQCRTDNSREVGSKLGLPRVLRMPAAKLEM